MTAHRCTVCGGDLDTGARCHNPACRPPVSAPAARIAEIVAEGRRLEWELAAENARKRPDWHLVSELSSRLFHIYMQHGPALLAVAEAAVEWEAADAEQRRVPALSRDTDLFERMLFRYQSATRALRAAVRGEEKTS